MVSEIRWPRCGQLFVPERGITGIGTIVSQVNDEGRPSTPEDQLKGHLRWCRRSTLHRRDPGKRFNPVPWGYADIVSVRRGKSRDRGYVLRHVATRDAPPCELHPGERRLKKRYRLDSLEDGEQILRALE